MSTKYKNNKQINWSNLVVVIRYFEEFRLSNCIFERNAYIGRKPSEIHNLLKFKVNFDQSVR